MGNEKSKPEKVQLNPTELQTYIMVTQVKLNQGRNKKIVLIKKKREEIIKYLQENNLDIAKAKMQTLMVEEDYVTVYDILGPLCEILKEKVSYIMMNKDCPNDIRAALDTLIYSSSRLEIEELHAVRKFIAHKFTNIYVDKANANVDKLVNVNVVDKLTIQQYPEVELISRLKAICSAENIDFNFPQMVNPLVFDNSDLNNQKIPGIIVPLLGLLFIFSQLLSSWAWQFQFFHQASDKAFGCSKHFCLLKELSRFHTAFRFVVSPKRNDLNRFERTRLHRRFTRHRRR